MAFEMQKLTDTRQQVSAAYGEKTMRTASTLEPFTIIPTGIFMLDLALCGGICESTANMFLGWESVGKTTNCYRVIGEFQKKYPNKRVAWIDLDPMGIQQEWAAAQGADMTKVELLQAPSGQAAVDLADVAAHTEEISLIIVDPLSGIVHSDIVEKSAEDGANYAYMANQITRLCTKMRIYMLERAKIGNKLTVLSTNQWRYKQVQNPKMDNRVLPGGVLSNFFHQTKVELFAKKINMENGKITDKNDAYEGGFKIWKSKGSSGLKEGAFEMVTDPQNKYGYGTVVEFDQIRNYAAQMGIMEGRAPKLYVPMFDYHFRTGAEVSSLLQTDKEFNLYMRQATLAKFREIKGMTPFPIDNYLGGAKKLAPLKTTASTHAAKPAASPAKPKFKLPVRHVKTS